MNINDIRQENITLIGSNNFLKGNLELNGIIKISAKIEGNLKVNQGQLVLERASNFTGDIECQDIEIFGTFNGNINSTGRVIIHTASSVTGKINANKLTVFPGAITNMECSTPKEKLK